ncbi:CPBP family intramembrane glutamic endopeptidase [Saliphagus infecundisoli]|uniref:CPBP family intramembrane glutamic endopeptidase n=1 Tax=Saliphagus infecundisoli TaxID=1849069 RepID=A0ABD5QK68_9EURY|nr:type II CAAX endopeptidase family protein [Saliphagus infecundisoli]
MTTTVNSRSHRLGRVGAFVSGREIATFFGLTLALSWAVWVPGAVDIVEYGALVSGIIVVGGFGPLVAAAIVTWLVGDSLRSWAGQVLDWRVRPRWYLAAVGIPLLVVAGAVLVYVVLGNSIGRSEILQEVPIYGVVLIHGLSMVSVFLVGGGQEELGWRGFALPRLLEQFTAVSASLVIGAVWAVWHLPLFVLEGSGQYGGSFVPYLIGLLALSILFTWVYRATGRSVLLVMILHASYNASAGSMEVLLPIQNAAALSWVLAGIMWVLAIGLIVVYGRDLCHGNSDDRVAVEGRAPPAA